MSDYDRLVDLLGAAFDGTLQEGSTLPIVYDEYGVEARVPAAKRGLHGQRAERRRGRSTRRRRRASTATRC